MPRTATCSRPRSVTERTATSTLLTVALTVAAPDLLPPPHPAPKLSVQHSRCMVSGNVVDQQPVVSAAISHQGKMGVG
eukprot:m.52311 g.52311  ORF g.52311 m.52311 type:complete len:78 (-) comp9094_c0_seq2:314-547(-)